MKISFVNNSIEASGSLILFFTKESGLFLSKQSDNDLKVIKLYQTLLSTSKDKKIADDIYDIVLPHGNAYDRIIFFKLDVTKYTQEYDWVKFGGSVCSYLTQNKVRDINVRFESNLKKFDSISIPSLISYGISLKAYSFNKYKTKKNKYNFELGNIRFLTNNFATISNQFSEYRKVIDGVNLARDLVNEPANILTPEEFVRRIASLNSPKLNIKILPLKKLQKLDMGALLSVAHGSRKEPYVAIMEYLPNKNQKPLAFLGKGVTFDTGGVSIKPSGGMEEMKGDMAGAATVVGLLKILSDRNANINAIGLVGLVENMTDGNAMRPGDIITSMSGKTIEVLNTDAEGRLVLADLVTYAIKNYNPNSIIDLATLTGAILVALGQEKAGLFSNNDDLAKKLIKSGEKTGEPLWRMPLGDNYRKMIDSKVADIKNIGGRYAGAITAAEFIHEFTEKVPWAHIDIAGTSISSLKNEINSSWASGFGVRLLNEYVKDFEKS
tara:strand:+ start:15161 stop:16645 length:1485 start_codon:yes stop_codon:yes gene_type:complete